MSIDKFGKYHHHHPYGSSWQKNFTESVFTIVGTTTGQLDYIHLKQPGYVKLNVEKPKGAVLKKKDTIISSNQLIEIETGDVINISFPGGTQQETMCIFECEYYIKHSAPFKEIILTRVYEKYIQHKHSDPSSGYFVELNVVLPKPSAFKKNGTIVLSNKVDEMKTNDVFEVVFPSDTHQYKCIYDYIYHTKQSSDKITKKIEFKHDVKVKLSSAEIIGYECCPKLMTMYQNGKIVEDNNLIGTVLKKEDQLSFYNPQLSSNSQGVFFTFYLFIKTDFR